MATQQEINDLVYDIKLVEQQQQLREIFSEAILGWAKLLNLNTFSEISAYSGAIILSYTHKKTLKGLGYFSNATSLFVNNSQLTDIGDISGLNNLIEFRCNDNPLTDIGDISEMTSLQDLYIQSTSLASIGDLRALVSLRRLVASNCQLSDVGDLKALINLDWVYLNNNNFTTAKIDAILNDLVVAYQAGAPITIVDLSGNEAPTNGVNNSSYLYLTGQGVSVTIDA